MKNISFNKFIVFGLMFGVVGAVLLFKSFAASPSVAFEPENSTLSGNATVGSDQNASGGKYILFGAGAPPIVDAARAFSANSYWNTKMPANAPIDASSAAYINDSLIAANTQNYLQITGAPDASQAFATPTYRATSSDPLYTITPIKYGETIQVRIPKGAAAPTGSDGQITIYDPSNNQVVGLHIAVYNSTTNQWTASSTDRYILSSNGLEAKAAGSDNANNFGHRGIPASVRQITIAEVNAGAIERRTECFWHATAEKVYWPMTNFESGKGGIIPEGVVVRIKPGVNLATKGLNPTAFIMAKSLQDYGCIVGDNSGSGNRLKVEANVAGWTALGIKSDSLASIPWSEWEVIKGGYDPVTGQVR